MGNCKKCFHFFNVTSIFLALATRSAGQAPIATDDICLREQNVPDNLSCPRLDGQLQCYSRNELCNQVQFCADGSDEGNSLRALDCKFEA